VVDHVACNGEVTALSTVILKVEGSDEVLTKFCASTVSSQENNAPPNGQVLIFNVHPKDATSGKMLTVMSRLDVQGCIYAITSVNGLLAVAKDSSVCHQSFASSLFPNTSIDSQVTILRLEQFGTTDYRLIKLHEWNHNYVITSLSPLPSGQGLALGDAINSVSVLTIENNVLKTAARDNTPLWPVSVSALDDQTVIGVNVRRVGDFHPPTSNRTPD
jgi:DNA damage-binding protein 1